MELKVLNLKKSYNDNLVLKDISFSVKDSKILTIIGDSGCGKSTLLKTLNFIEKKNDGIILLDKESEATTNFRLNFGLVFQNFNLFPSLNVLDNILVPLKSKIKREIKECKVKFFNRKEEFNKKMKSSEEYLNYLIDKLNIRAILKSYPNNISGGQAQRVAIARSLIINPYVLCLDEPTSALDPKLVNEVADLILSLKDLGKIIIVVTHDIKLAKKISDDVIFMKDGTIVEAGDVSILDSPLSTELKDFLK